MEKITAPGNKGAIKNFLLTGVRQAMVIAIIGALVALIFNGFRESQLALIAADDEEVSIIAAAGMYRDGRVVFVDARDVWSYEEMGHLPGAINVERHNVATHVAELKRAADEGKRIVAYCDGENCRLGSDVARELRLRGVPNVGVLHNGWSLWERAGLPLEKGKGQRRGK